MAVLKNVKSQVIAKCWYSSLKNADSLSVLLTPIASNRVITGINLGTLNLNITSYSVNELLSLRFYVLPKTHTAFTANKGSALLSEVPVLDHTFKCITGSTSDPTYSSIRNSRDSYTGLQILIPADHVLAAVAFTDKYGNPQLESPPQWANVSYLE
jgi:hypothetical protein